MDKVMMVPIVLILVVVVYAIYARHKPMDKREVLFHKIIDKGCENCGYDFNVIHAELTKETEMMIECEFCWQRYKIDHMMQWAWRL